MHVIVKHFCVAVFVRVKSVEGCCSYTIILIVPDTVEYAYEECRDIISLRTAYSADMYKCRADHIETVAVVRDLLDRPVLPAE